MYINHVGNLEYYNQYEVDNALTVHSDCLCYENTGRNINHNNLTLKLIIRYHIVKESKLGSCTSKFQYSRYAFA